jgi:16S rRNA U516 pseudouridylate synthase RsuA-like enzyme
MSAGKTCVANPRVRSRSSGSAHVAQGERLDPKRARCAMNGAVVFASSQRRVTPERDVIEVDGTRVARIEHVYSPAPHAACPRDDDGWIPRPRDDLPSASATPSLPASSRPSGRLDKGERRKTLGVGPCAHERLALGRPRLLDPGIRTSTRVTTSQVRTTNPGVSSSIALPLGVVERTTGEKKKKKNWGGFRPSEVRDLTACARARGAARGTEVVLDEGKEPTIGRILRRDRRAVARLVRVAIGSLVLGDLAKGAWRMLRADEIDFASPTGPVGAETEARADAWYAGDLPSPRRRNRTHELALSQRPSAAPRASEAARPPTGSRR